MLKPGKTNKKLVHVMQTKKKLSVNSKISVRQENKMKVKKGRANGLRMQIIQT